MPKTGPDAGAASPSRSEDESRWQAWMVRAQEGDAEAYRLLLEEISGVIHAYLRKSLGDLPQLEDCVQDCLLAIHRARHTYQPSRPFRPWLFAVVRHKAVDALRRRAVHEGRRDDVDLDARPAHADPPDRGLDGRRALAGLPPEFREAIVLTKYEGYTTAEAARKAGVSVAAMKARVHRALWKIRRELSEVEE